jgi:GT2 family glycosyltransferase
MMIRPSALNSVGLLDERYFLYLEEIDLAFRLHNAGFKIYYLPQASIIHIGRASGTNDSEVAYSNTLRSLVLFVRKFHGKGQALAVAAMLVAGRLLRGVSRDPDTRRRAVAGIQELCSMLYLIATGDNK